MNCPYCAGASSVKNSRAQKQRSSIWRRRQCQKCGQTWTTIENIEPSGVIRVQHNPRHLKPLERDEIYIMLYESCKHRKTAASDATGLTQTILRQIYLGKSVIIQKNNLNKLIYKTLARFDTAAASYFTAYYDRTAKTRGE